jgi:6-phosphogluconolactonase
MLMNPRKPGLIPDRREMKPHPMHETSVRVYSGIEALNKAAADVFAETARSSVAARGRFVVALSGGRTPLPTYRLLSLPPYSEQIPWDRTYIFWGDERSVPRDDPRNNAAAAFHTLLDHVPITGDRIYRIDSDASPQEAAQRYDTLLRRFFGDQEPRFDLIFLGLGEDGHTASLFPGSPVLDEQKQWVQEVYLPVQNIYRITLTLVVINQASRIAFLVQGRDKSKILREVLDDQGSHGQLPVQRIRPVHGELMWLIDEEAARDLQRTHLQGG